jgi:cytochrome c556
MTDAHEIRDGTAEILHTAERHEMPQSMSANSISTRAIWQGTDMLQHAESRYGNETGAVHRQTRKHSNGERIQMRSEHACCGSSAQRSELLVPVESSWLKRRSQRAAGSEIRT